MSMRAVEFVENWVSENIGAGGPPEIAGATALTLASRCLEAAMSAGIPQSEIKDTFDDLPAFMTGEIEEANERNADRASLDDE